MFVMSTMAANTGTNWDLYDKENDAIRINLQRSGTGSNLWFHVILYVDDVETIHVDVPAKDFGSGTFDAYVTIGGYTLFVPIQGNDMGKKGDPEIVDGIGVGHNWNEVGRLNPTCGLDGYISYECKTHGERYTEVLSALGHDFTVLVGHEDATCTGDGFDVFKCSRCDETETVVIPAIGHDWSTNVVDPTCTEQGYTEHICANDASHNYVDSCVAALGHDFTVLIERVPATRLADGYELYKCSRCDETKLVIIPRLVCESAVVSSYNKNLQDKNNENLRFTVTVTLSDGSSYDVNHAEKVNGQQKGSKTFVYEGYSVYVAWNDNNTVTTCIVVSDDNTNTGTGTGNANGNGNNNTKGNGNSQ
jgi:hypothetical protein